MKSCFSFVGWFTSTFSCRSTVMRVRIYCVPLLYCQFMKPDHLSLYASVVADILAGLDSLDNGKPYSEALNIDARSSAATFRYYGGWSDKRTYTIVWSKCM